MRKPGRRYHPPPASPRWNLARDEEERTRLVLALAKAALPQLRKLLPGANQRAMKRAVERLEKYGHLYNMPRPGRPSKYTSAQMAAAVKVLVEDRQTLHTIPTLIKQLRVLGILPSKVDTATFAAHLKKYVKDLGHHLTMNSTSTVPAMVPADVPKRLTYCRQMLGHLATHPLGALVFIDETTLQHAGHPKGASALATQELAMAAGVALRKQHQPCCTWLMQSICEPAQHFADITRHETTHICTQSASPLLWFAGQSKVTPHLHIPGLMQPPQRQHTAAKLRDNLNVAVAISQFGGAYVKETTGTRYPGCPALRTYKDVKGRRALHFSAFECRDFIKAALQHFKQQREFRAHLSDVMLVFDRHNVHRSTVVTSWLQKQGISYMLAPPRSPDLMPLDYAVFGAAKLSLSKQLPATGAWSDRAHKFLELLRHRPSAAVFDAFKKRLVMCIKEHGGMIEQPLRAAAWR